MEERQVTTDGKTKLLPEPFMVVATQNPIEHEGTYPLPEAQLDRFMMRVAVGYPSRDKELEMLETHSLRSTFDDLEPVVTPERWPAMIEIARHVQVVAAVQELHHRHRRRHPPPSRGSARGQPSIRPLSAEGLRGPGRPRRVAITSRPMTSRTWPPRSSSTGSPFDPRRRCGA